MKQPRAYSKKNGVSTRDAIIDMARDIINKGGVIDFRIETLAQALGLSPGNITYHFPRKEDIISVIWENSNQQIDGMLEQLTTPLLDVKQLFLILRATAMNSLDYIGVKSFYNGDVGNLKRRFVENYEYVTLLRRTMFGAYSILASNGYMTEIPSEMLKELTFQTQFLSIRWWSNLSMLDGDYDQIKIDIDQHCLNAIYPLMPYLTDSGRRQYDSILAMINRN